MRILSGIQPSGRLHVGNFFGMMQPSIRLQEEGEAFYFIADYHSLTTVQDPEALRKNVCNVAIDFLACGLDPNKAVFFKQSDVPEVTELSWLLSTVTPMGFLNRCHSYKDKTERDKGQGAEMISCPEVDRFKFDFDPAGADRLENLVAVAYEKLKTHDTFKGKTTDV